MFLFRLLETPASVPDPDQKITQMTYFTGDFEVEFGSRTDIFPNLHPIENFGYVSSKVEGDIEQFCSFYIKRIFSK